MQEGRAEEEGWDGVALSVVGQRLEQLEDAVFEQEGGEAVEEGAGCLNINAPGVNRHILTPMQHRV
jgi:hypothetical protein